MARSSELDRFVRDALTAGRSRDEISSVLVDAGWRRKDVVRSLGLYAEGGFTPPVPRPQAFVSARDGFLYGMTFVALVIVVVNLTSALFDLTEWALRDDKRLDLSWVLAALIVFTPVFVLLDRLTRDEDRDSPMRKVFAYGALFIAALVLLGSLVGAIALALSGGLGLEVAVKFVTVGLIACGVFGYYRKGLEGDSLPVKQEGNAR